MIINFLKPTYLAFINFLVFKIVPTSSLILKK